jgi:SAM-dependent methyltransferase
VSKIVNTDQHAAWNGDSGLRWVADADRRDRVMAPIADALLAAAGLAAGVDVLDVGCGCGATTLAAARLVAPGGACGIDLSEPMLAVARARADRQGVGNVTFVHGDAQAHPLPGNAFDVAISRFGTMFFADPTMALTNIATALAPGGRVSLATWQPLGANEWLTAPGAALLRNGHLPETTPGTPGMFAQSDPDTIATTLRHAGYDDIDLEPLEVTLTLGSDPTEATDYLAKAGPGRAVLDTISPDQHPAALAAVRAVLTDRADDTGVHLGAAIWLITATLAAPETLSRTGRTS